MEAPSPPTLQRQRIRDAWNWATSVERRPWGVPPILVLILAVALALRLYGSTWDQGNFFHPDERSIYMRVDCMYRVLTESPDYLGCTRDAPFQNIVPGFPSPTVFLDAEKSSLNPHWFPLGTLIIYVLLAIKLVLAPLVTTDLQDLALIGRTLSALADVATVAVVYVLGRRLYGRGAALLAATLVTFAVIHIQLSHFYRPETLTNLFTLAAFWSMLQVIERRRVRDSALLGVFVGLAFATKVSVLPLLIPLTLVYGSLLYKTRRSSPSRWRTDQLEKMALRVIIGGGAAIAVYLFWTPYAVLDFPGFLEWNLRELDIVRNAGTVPYTVQYVGAPSFLYELRQTSLWGLGLPLGLLAWGGLLATVLLNVRRPRLGQILLLLWAIPLFLSVGSVEVKFLRYTFTMMPALILMGSGTALMGINWLRGRRRWLGKAAVGALALVVAATVFYALAFESIYTTPHPAVQASRWLNANIPPGAPILTDNHWDEGIPDLGRYRVSQLPMFEGDSVGKMKAVASDLSNSEYLVFYSNRTYGAIARVPELYPFSSGYYKLLFSGDLGYLLTTSFSSYPSLLGVTLADDTFGRAGLPVPEPLADARGTSLALNLGYADNDVITYDHPLVLVFKNAAHYKQDYLLDLLLTKGVETQPTPPLMLTPDELAIQQQDSTRSRLFDADGLSNRFPVGAWLLLVLVASLVAFPLGFLVFRGLADRGYLLTKSLAVLILAYLPWLLAALKLIPFGRPAIYLGLLGLAIVATGIIAVRRQELLAFLRARWRVLLLEEGLFLAAFLAFVAIRWANPDLWHPFRGGEKPMDFAYLNAVIGSSTIPPYDPWFAGGYLNYYYFGQFIVATLIIATGILPEVAYNLAVPLLFALTVGGAFSVVYNLTYALRQRRPSRQGPAWGPAAAGVAAVFLVVVLGNLGGAIQLIYGAGQALVSGVSFPPFDFWASSRMMPGQISITEFPYWSFLFADLHAHLIAIPFTLLAVGLSLSILLAADEYGTRWRTAMLHLAILALTVGSLAAINTWDYPTYLLLAMSAVLLASYVSRAKLDIAVITRGVLAAGLLFLLSYAAFLPFHQRFVAFSTGVHASTQQTAIHHYLAIHGLFVIVVLSYLVFEGRRHLGHYLRPNRVLGAQPAGPPSTTRRAFPKRGFTPVALGVSLFLAVYLVAAGYATVAFLLLLTVVVVLLGVSRLLERNGEAPLHLFLLILVGGAFALGMVVDLVTVNDDIDRMNTVFKLYLQAWVLFGLASAAMLWHLATAARLSWRTITWGKGVWLGLLLLLVAGVTVFPVLGTRARLADRFSTEFTGLSGAQYMETSTYRDPNGPIQLRWDWVAIQWLRDNVQGSPVVAEGNAAPHQYRWGSRVSIYTGLPTVMGWGWHQTQQRQSDRRAVDERMARLSILFSTTNKAEAAQILRDHNVKYVYVGELERLYYPAEGLAKFLRMTDYGVALVYTNPEVEIFQVTLPEARASRQTEPLRTSN